MPSKKTYQQNLEYLYTKGGQFSISGSNYNGEYHYDNGIPMTGPTKTTPNRVRLEKFYVNNDLYIYEKITNLNNTKFIDPVFKPETPTEKDYEKGWFFRYFVFRNNNKDSEIFEIDQVQYNNIGSKIDSSLYTGFAIKWKLTGTKQEIEKNNSDVVSKIIEQYQLENFGFIVSVFNKYQYKRDNQLRITAKPEIVFLN